MLVGLREWAEGPRAKAGQLLTVPKTVAFTIRLTSRSTRYRLGFDRFNDTGTGGSISDAPPFIVASFAAVNKKDFRFYLSANPYLGGMRKKGCPLSSRFDV